MITKDDAELAESFQNLFSEKIGDSYGMTKLVKVVGLVKERANFVTDLYDLADYFFVAPTSYDEKAAKNWKEETPSIMQQVITELNKIEDFKNKIEIKYR